MACARHVHGMCTACAWFVHSAYQVAWCLQVGSKWTLTLTPHPTPTPTPTPNQVGSKWARGVVSRVFSSPKWLTVTLESGQTRPTQRDQVILDAPAPPDQLTPSALVLASSPPDLFWRKAELLEVLPEAALTLTPTLTPTPTPTPTLTLAQARARTSCR